MTESLRDQLLRLGLKPTAVKAPPQPAQRPGGKPSNRIATKTERRPAPSGERRPQTQVGARPNTAPVRAAGAAHSGEAEIDLARAYALREREQRAEQQAARRAAEQATAARRERKRRLRELIAGQSLNHPEAEIARHFPHGDKIKRIYVSAEQLPQLNAGELGVVQIEGRFHLVPRALALSVAEVAPEALLLLPDPDAVDSDELGPVQA